MPPAQTASASTSARRLRHPATWGIALLVLLAAVWVMFRALEPGSPRQDAHELWLSAVLAWQTVGGGGSTPAEINRVEDMFTRAIELDPTFAEAYGDRSRVRSGKFVAGLDTSDANIAAAKADLARARELAGPRPFVLVHEARLAYLVEGDMERALDLLEQAEAAGPLDADQLMTKANFLAFAGRQEQSLPVYAQAARLDPGNAVIVRFWMVNLFAAHRPAEALRVVAPIDARFPGRIERGEWLFSYTGDTRRWRTEIEAANRFGKLPNAISNEFDLLRMEGDRAALGTFVANLEPTEFRPHSASRSIIAALSRPVAELRGWERLLAGDAAGAAAAGTELREFLARQAVQPWNEWMIRLLEAEAAVMHGETALAREKVGEAQGAAPQYPNFASSTYPRMMAARVLAWAGDAGGSVALLEVLASRFPGVGPASISRDPLLQAPLGTDPRWQALRQRLEAQVRAHQHLGS
jgi:tetratricopeptide (TPR) repeat protein